MNEIQLQLYTYNNNFFSHEGRAPHLFFFGIFFIGFFFGLDYLLSVVREINYGYFIYPCCVVY